MQVRVEKVAHGGHFIARNEGQVIFIRDTAPGELVDIEITSKAKGFLRANVLNVIEPSPNRITPPCAYAGKCGGCDFQHLNVAYQRQLKADVIKEQFSRIAKMEIDVTVHEVTPTTHYRTHIRGVANEAGQFGIYASRSHDIIPIKDCLIAGEELHVEQIATEKFEPLETIEVPIVGLVSVLFVRVSVPANVANVPVTVGRVRTAVLLAIPEPVRSRLSPEASSYTLESVAFAIRGNLFAIYNPYAGTNTLPLLPTTVKLPAETGT